MASRSRQGEARPVLILRAERGEPIVDFPLKVQSISTPGGAEAGGIEEDW